MKQLKKWIIENYGIEVWNNFKKNIKTCSCTLKNLTDFKKYIKARNIEPHRYIICAFAWDKTQEGLEFWIDMDSEWRKYKETN